MRARNSGSSYLAYLDATLDYHAYEHIVMIRRKTDEHGPNARCLRLIILTHWFYMTNNKINGFFRYLNMEVTLDLCTTSTV